MPLAVLRQRSIRLDGMVCSIGEFQHRHSGGNNGISNAAHSLCVAMGENRHERLVENPV